MLPDPSLGRCLTENPVACRTIRTHLTRDSSDSYLGLSRSFTPSDPRHTMGELHQRGLTTVSSPLLGIRTRRRTRPSRARAPSAPIPMTGADDTETRRPATPGRAPEQEMRERPPSRSSSLNSIRYFNMGRPVGSSHSRPASAMGASIIGTPPVRDWSQARPASSMSSRRC